MVKLGNTETVPCISPEKLETVVCQLFIRYDEQDKKWVSNVSTKKLIKLVTVSTKERARIKKGSQEDSFLNSL
jgi:hypothetical protein